MTGSAQFRGCCLMYPWWIPSEAVAATDPDLTRMCWADLVLYENRANAACNRETNSELGLCEEHERELLGEDAAA